MATIQDVAKRAGVSKSTVSRVLNDQPSVLAPVRKAVLQAIAELDYHPNAHARGLRTRRSSVIGLLLPTLSTPIMPRLVEGAGAAAAEHGYLVTVAQVQQDEELQVQYLRELLSGRIDGLLWYQVGPVDDPLSGVTPPPRIPVVLLNRGTPHSRYPSLVLDEGAAFDEAVAHLVELGHRRIGIIADASRSLGGRWRMERLRTLRAEHGLVGPSLEWVVDAHHSVEDVVDAALAHPESPTAIFVTRIGLALPIFSQLHRRGAVLPRDLSLIAFGDADWAAALAPSISVITTDPAANGRAATELLLRHIRGDESAPSVLSPRSQYIRRESVGAPGRP